MNFQNNNFSGYQVSRGGGFAAPPYRNFSPSTARSFGSGGRYNSQFNGYKKHSGCTSGRSQKNDTPYVRGWKYSKGAGMQTFFAAPYHGTKKRESKTGNTWFNWICKIFNQRTGQTTITTCLVNQQLNKVIISSLGFVMNTKGGKGGYVGPFYVRK